MKPCVYAVIISQNTYLWILQAKCEPNKGYRRVHCHGFQKLLQNKRCCQEMIYNITRNPILNENLYISVAQSNSCKTQGHFLLVQISDESNRTFWFVRFIFSSWKARMKGQKTFILQQTIRFNRLVFPLKFSLHDAIWSLWLIMHMVG